MARGRRLFKLAAILFAVAGIITATMSNASAATGADGFPILYASSQNEAHQCTAFAGDTEYRVVVCSDILTYEDSADYYAYGREEVICQTASSHATVPCYSIQTGDFLAAGDGASTDEYVNSCGLNCPDGRFYVSTRKWVYKIGDAEGGRCSANAGSSYVLWNVVKGGAGADTQVETPDYHVFTLGVSGNGNDGQSESSGHYFICP
jgi:hypothetical protein